MFTQKKPERIWQDISNSLISAAGSRNKITNRHQLSGGSINSAFRAETELGKSFFIKLNREALLPMFEAEAQGLLALYKTGTIRVPEPVCTGAGHGYSWIVTEYISFGRGNAQSQELFGRGLAEMHRCTADHYGWHRNNTIGSTAQVNNWEDDWPVFFGKHRLTYQLRLAADSGNKGSLLAKGDQIMAGLAAFFTNYNPSPSLLHGDLWSGNQAVDDSGNPVIFDPAVYFGDRETDLAMTTLFGSFSDHFYKAYEEAWPLDAGFSKRKTLYNLYHILNHAHLFGGGYAMQAESMMDRLLDYI